MAIKTYKPTTPSRRNMTVTDYSGLSKVKPEKSLLEPLKKNSGRNSYGRITVRHRGGGNRRKYRVIDFKRAKDGMNATVLTLEYDPNRSAFIALVQYEDGEKRYILAPEGLKVGAVVRSGADADIKPGNALPLVNIPVGTFIHAIELYPGKGAQLVRSAGNMAQLTDTFMAVFNEKMKKNGITDSMGIIYRYKGQTQYSNNDSLSPRTAYCTTIQFLDARETVSVQAWVNYNIWTIIKYIPLLIIFYVVCVLGLGALLILIYTYYKNKKFNAKDNFIAADRW